MKTENLCCEFYESDIAKILFGDSMHVGGLELTKKLCISAGVANKDHVIDIGCGYGASSIFIAKEFGCNVTGIDPSKKMIDYANSMSKATENRVKFLRVGIKDFDQTGFDAALCECVFSLLKDKQTVSKHIFSSLADDGKFLVSDFVVEEKLPEKLNNILMYVSCISKAENLDGYKNIFESTGFRNFTVYDCKQELEAFISMLDTKLKLASAFLGKDFISKVSGIEFDELYEMLAQIKSLIEKGSIRYCIMTMVK